MHLHTTISLHLKIQSIEEFQITHTTAKILQNQIEQWQIQSDEGK